MDYHEEEHISPKQVRIAKEPSVVSTSSSKFRGGEQMIEATQDILGRQSLEGSVLVGRGEDTSVPREYIFQPFFLDLLPFSWFNASFLAAVASSALSFEYLHF